METPPPETRPKTLEQVKRENDLVAKARKGLLVEKGTEAAGRGCPHASRCEWATRRSMVEVDDASDLAAVAGGRRLRRAPALPPDSVILAPDARRRAAGTSCGWATS